MKVLLVDDHPLILSALEIAIRDLDDALDVVGVNSATAAREALQADPVFDLVLLDLKLGETDGFELLAELRSTYPSLPVVVVSASDRSSDVIRSIDMGAMGFVPKRANTATLFAALRLVMSGGVYVPPMTLGLEGSALPPVEKHATPACLQVVGPEAAAGEVQTAMPTFGLTPRQNDVLALLLQGKPNKLIARDLNLSVETVKDHVAAVLRTLGVNSRTQAVLAVSQMNQIGASRPAAWRRVGR